MNKADYEQQLTELLLAGNALMLATTNEEGLPEASYAPYIDHAGCYYIFVSALAAHTGNLKRSGVVSVLILDDQSGGNAYARKRLTCHCQATSIAGEDALFELVMQQLEKKFGKLIATLRGLNDFQLFQLTPKTGNFVAGFGQAFDLEFPLDGKLRHRNPG